MINRRELLARLAALGVVALPTPATAQTRPLNILWRNAWAIVNIGDIGHVPGALAQDTFFPRCSGCTEISVLQRQQRNVTRSAFKATI